MKEKYINPFTDFGFKLQERVFERLFSIAEITKFSPIEREEYEKSLKVYRDLKNSLDTAWEEGREKGRNEHKDEVALLMLRNGEDIKKDRPVYGAYG